MYSIEKRATPFFLSLKKLIISKKVKEAQRNKVKSREIESVNSPKTSGLQDQKVQKKI